MDIRRYVVGVIDKIGEACFFLQKLEGASGFLECSYFASAFGSACYSVIECLRRAATEPPEARAWWSRTFEALKKSPMHRYFHEGRNEDIHEGFGLVSGIELKLIDSGGELITEEKSLLADSPYHSPGAPAHECRDYFESMLRLSLEGYRLFAATWDPDSALAHAFGELESKELGRTH